MKIIDIHNHLAWDIDDGISSKEETIEVLSKARREGIKCIVSTPHFIPGVDDRDRVDIKNKRIEELKELGDNYNVRIVSGCELFLNHEYLDLVDHGLVNTIENTNYLLVEFDVRRQLGKYEDVEERLYELSIRGYKVILAHVERYFPDGLDLKRVQELHDEGYILQVNKSSLLGIHGKTMKNNALTLIENNLIHVIASDCHSLKGRDISFREVYDLLVKKFKQKQVDLLVYDNPMHILNNEMCEDTYIKRSLLNKLIRR